MTRVVTSALMGDPKPGRSALDRPETADDFQARMVAEGEVAMHRAFAKADAPPRAQVDPAIRSAGPGAASSSEQGPTGLCKLPEAEPRGPGEKEAPLRPIEAISLDDADRPQPPLTAPPVFLDVDPRSLLIEGAYQRDLTPKSLAQIRKIALGWDWRKYHPPVVVMTDDGGVILDGQHTAIAAASRPDMPTIPVQLVEAPDVADRAQAFIGLNTGQLAHSAVGLHKAAVAAGDVTACAVDRICKAAGVTVRARFGGAHWNAGDTASVGQVRALLASVGERKAVQVLQALVSAGCAPIASNEIRAAEMLFTNPDYVDQLNPLDDGGGADLAAAIRSHGEEALREAKVFAKAQCEPLWKALGVMWFRKTRKRRKAA